MKGRIITARHGRPDLARDMRMPSSEYGAWWAKYDASGLHPDEAPPEELIEIAAKAETIVSSTLPRAIEPAQQLTRGARTVPADALFVEAPLPQPPVPFLKLRPGAWGVVSRGFWLMGFTPPGVESNRQAWERVARVSEYLRDAAAEGDILLCAHGWLNYMLDRQLKRDGWKRTEGGRGNHYWSWRVYEAPLGQEGAGRNAQTALAE